MHRELLCAPTVVLCLSTAPERETEREKQSQNECMWHACRLTIPVSCGLSFAPTFHMLLKDTVSMTRRLQILLTLSSVSLQKEK